MASVPSAGDGEFLEGYLPYLLRRADQTLSAPFYAVLTRYGISRSEWRVLAVLAETDQLSVVELAREALSPQPTVTHAVRRLEKRNLVSRLAGSADKRQRFISVTPTGAQLAATLISEAQKLSTTALAGVDDLSTIIRELERLTAIVDQNVREQLDDDSRAG